MLDFPRWKVASILGLLACLMALAIPSFLPDSVTNSWGRFPHPKVNLGLDLAGGSYLLLEADTKELVKNRLEAKREEILNDMNSATPPIQIGDIATDGAIAVRIYHKPMIRWIWLGALIMALGGALALTDARYRKKMTRSKADANGEVVYE